MSTFLAAAIVMAGPVVQHMPPPIVSYPRAPGPHAVPVERPQQQLGRWMMRPVFCAGMAPSDSAVQSVVREPDPDRFLTWRRPQSQSQADMTLTLEFRIDATGRPLSIRRRVVSEAKYVPDAEDVLPAFAASRFAAGSERTGCQATFVVAAAPIAEASVADLMAYSLFPSGTPPKAVWDRITPVGGNCTNPPPDVLLRAFPAFKTMPDQPGYRTWSMTGYDIDPSGKPRNVRTIGGSGMPALDRASRDAIAGSRFERGARTGCFYPYYKNATILTAPTAPTEDEMRPAGTTCPHDHGWNQAPALIYPTRYWRRSIEGWAMIAYDVAPWGQTGNVRVLKAEPSAEFGDAAAAMIRNATLKTAGTGYIGCIDRVRYVMRKPGVPVQPGAPDAIVD